MMHTPGKSDVERAIGELRHAGVPPKYRSASYCLAVEGVHLPPKLVLSLASRVSPRKFLGGRTTNSLLETLGYKIVSCSCGGDGSVRWSHWFLSWRLPSPSMECEIARIILNWNYQYRLKDACEILDAVANTWPGNRRVQYLLTCGGFVECEWPKDLVINSSDVFDRLSNVAKRAVSQILTRSRRLWLARHAKYFSVGVDIYTDPDDLNRPHIEFVGLTNLQKGTWECWTGKWYPVPSQERGLLRYADLKSHFAVVGDARVFLLGCNDLAIWSPRGAANRRPGSQRWNWSRDMKREFRKELPGVVLHHPHRTHSTRVWGQAWAKLAHRPAKVKHWASAWRFCDPQGNRPKSGLSGVLQRTHHPDSLDVVVNQS